ncbi:glycosyltransferase family 2 protein [Nonlabens sp.]|uniref:glycosyltransferase family 2 protein n=1 Tax=Nonlabens sp. TaxID=1888209 RepID=UPI003F6953FE
MSLEPFFSVAIPLYNKESYITDTLKNIFAQEFNDFEVVIVDDGSTDNGAIKVQELNDSRIRLYTQENKGASAARNAAIEKCNGKFIAVLDADDSWEPLHLQHLKELIENFPEAVMYCTNYQLRRENDVMIPARFSFSYHQKPLLIDDFFDGMKQFGIATSSSTAFRKETFKKAGGYDTRIRSGQDTDLWIKVALQGKTAFHPAITMTYNSFDNSSLSSAQLYKARALMLDNFTKQEKINQSLKSFLDLNRYAIAISAKLAGDLDFYNNIVHQIKMTNLNKKQRFLLWLPVKVLKQLQLLQDFLIKRGIYLTAYR